jgi:integrase
MAVEAGVIPPGEGVKIDSVRGYDSREAVRIDERREQTRKSTKKEEPVKLNEEQAEELMSNHPDTPQGRRDRVLMHLALKHGLRVSEIAALNTDDVTLTYDEGDVISGMMRFYRPKVAGTEQETGEHLIMNGTLDAITQYIEKDAIPGERLMRGSRRGGNLTTPGVTERSLSMRIKTLGENVGIEGLTAHDCRHYAATRDGKRGKSVKYIMSKFGWTSAQTAMRYVHQDGPVVVD